MNKRAFRTLEVDAQLRYLADIRGVPKGTIGVVEETGWRDDGEGNSREGLCRVRVVEWPVGKTQYPFMKHLLTIYECEADQFECVDLG